MFVFAAYATVCWDLDWRWLRGGGCWRERGEGVINQKIMPSIHISYLLSSTQIYDSEIYPTFCGTICTATILIPSNCIRFVMLSNTAMQLINLDQSSIIIAGVMMSIGMKYLWQV